MSCLSRAGARAWSQSIDYSIYKPNLVRNICFSVGRDGVKYLLCLFGIKSLSSECHVKGVGKAGKGGKTLCAATSRQNTKHHLWQTHRCFHAINSNPGKQI